MSSPSDLSNCYKRFHAQQELRGAVNSAGDLRCLRLALASRLAALYLVFVGGWGVMFVSVVLVRARPCPSVRPPPVPRIDFPCEEPSRCSCRTPRVG